VADTKSASRRAISAAVAGNVLEWYDFAVYAYMASIIAKTFFPSGDEVTSLLSAFAAFGIGFVVRPLGGILIGRLADTRGRKTALLVTIALMAVGTVLIGLVPSYESIGIAAPLLVVFARLLQGFSAGGEWGGSTAFIVEWAHPARRGLYGSLQQSSVAAGLLLGAAVAALISSLLPAEAVEGWAWRIPFLLGGLIGPVGMYMRRHIGETPAFDRAALALPLKDTASHWVLGARAFGFTIVWTVSYYTVLSYLPTFLQRHGGLGRTQALWSTSVSLLVLVLAAPAFGLLSDRIGRKPLLIAACAGFIALTYPLFRLMLSGGTVTTVLMAQAGLALLIAVYSGPGPAAIAEIFPTRVRTTWMSAGYSLSVAMFGGFAPFIATWLIDRTDNPLAPSWYLIAAAVASALVILTLRETARESLQ
jgi:MHS family proline/betaine transporter-like MFS transporter